MAGCIRPVMESGICAGRLGLSSRWDSTSSNGSPRGSSERGARSYRLRDRAPAPRGPDLGEIGQRGLYIIERIVIQYIGSLG
jgi:hypothetical protein